MIAGARERKQGGRYAAGGDAGLASTLLPHSGVLRMRCIINCLSVVSHRNYCLRLFPISTTRAR
jgi:hypothetical protein